MNEEAQDLGPGPGDDMLNVEFYWYGERDVEKSIAQGHPVFRDVEYVRVQIPGDNANIVERPVRDIDQTRWPAQYRDFKRGVLGARGWPLRDWQGVPKLAPGQIKELDYYAVRSVEQLAALSDANIDRIGPYRKWRDQAREFVKEGLANAPVSKLRAAAATQQAEITELRAELERLKARGK